MAVIIGSARIDERGKLSGGKPGDQKQTGNNDYTGEVSQQKFYIHKKGWYILRPKNVTHAMNMAGAMVVACENHNIGYDQGRRYEIITKGVWSPVKIGCDCSSLVRECVKEATGVDPGDFNTESEANVLMKTGLFDKITYVNGMTLYTGDILVTKTKGHTVIVTQGAARAVDNKGCYPVFAGNTTSIVAALYAVGEKDTSFARRKNIAIANGINDYTGTAGQNTYLLNLLKQGRLKVA